jgi:cytochrome P450
MLGLPESDGDQFRAWIHGLLEEGPADLAVQKGAGRALLDYLIDHVDRHKDEPSDDIISFLLAARADDQPLGDRQVYGMVMLLLLAGIDTTWSSIGSALWHLAGHDADRERLVAEPDLIPTAVEEFLRAYAPVTMARYVAADTELGGCPVRAGQRLLLPFPAGNRDPDRFTDADRVVIDRGENRHYAFGLGVHRCLGSNLARMEMRVALEEWLVRFPVFHMADPAAVRWSAGQIRGPRLLPVVFA